MYCGSMDNSIASKLASEKPDSYADPLRPLWQIALISFACIPLLLLSIPVAVLSIIVSLLKALLLWEPRVLSDGLAEARWLVGKPWLMILVGFGGIWYLTVEKPLEDRRFARNRNV